MSENIKKKILIVGSSAKEHALAIKFLTYDNVETVYVAPGNTAIKEIVQVVDIREDNVQELLKFVIDNDIDLTIASSSLAIKNDIAEIFQANGQLIFAPAAESAKFALNNAFCKKFLYKQHIPTPRFGVFEKPQMAFEHLASANYPVVIKTEEEINGHDRQACSTFNIAKTFVEDLFARDEKKVIIEEYLYGHEFTLYAITDGYQALPVAAVAQYRFAEEGNGGFLTEGVGAFAPDYKLSADLVQNIMDNVIKNVLNALERQGLAYLGIIGVSGILRPDGKYSVLEFSPFFGDHDCACVLNLIDENLYTLFEACAVGSFADDYDLIHTSNMTAVSCVLTAQSSDKIINGLEQVENSEINHFATSKNEYLEYLTPKGKTLTLTSVANTLSRAKVKLSEDLETITFDGKKFRKDICNTKIG